MLMKVVDIDKPNKMPPPVFAKKCTKKRLRVRIAGHSNGQYEKMHMRLGPISSSVHICFFRAKLSFFGRIFRFRLGFLNIAKKIFFGPG